MPEFQHFRTWNNFCQRSRIVVIKGIGVSSAHAVIDFFFCIISKIALEHLFGAGDVVFSGKLNELFKTVMEID